MNAIKEFKKTIELCYYASDPEVYASPHNIPYLKEPGVVLLAQTATCLDGLSKFLSDMDGDFIDYIHDEVQLAHGPLLSKFAGQLCYLSLGPKRTKNKDADRYFDNIKKEKHGSILEHATYSFLFYGIDRAVTHEFVRHRAGKAYSQVSQRYVGPERLRYVMPAEFQGDPEGERIFFEDIRLNKIAYGRRIDYMFNKMPNLEDESNTEKRKRMQSFARRALANETEAPIVVTGNVRSWRHVFTKRVARGADRGIRSPTYLALAMLQQANPQGFSDFAIRSLPDGTESATPVYEGV